MVVEYGVLSQVYQQWIYFQLTTESVVRTVAYGRVQRVIAAIRLYRRSLISSILANLAMKPHLNRIALLRSHISMVFILFVSLIVGIFINLSILSELFEDEVGLIQEQEFKLILYQYHTLFDSYIRV